MVLSTWHPNPVDNGRKQRTLGLIDALAGDFDVVLVSLLAESEIASSGLPAVPGVWRQTALPLPTFESWSPRSLVGAMHRWPRSVIATWDPNTAQSIVDLALETSSSVVIGTDLRTLRYLRHLRHHVAGVRTILDEPDVSPFVNIGHDQGVASQLRARMRRRKYQRLLRESVDDLDAVLVAAPFEAAAYQRMSGGHAAHVIENGVHQFPDPWSVPASTSMLYTGSLTYAPNLEAVTWLARAILPLIVSRAPSAVLTVTGTLPNDLPEILRQPAFRFTGRLDDLDSVFRASRVFVAPILSGTGTRIKILEAMAMGIPVVTTSKGCEGIPLSPGDHALVADSPQEFALATLRVMQDPCYAQEVGARGRAFVLQHASWNASAVRLRELVGALLTENA
jgi:glycosyltransferase involved in cell wall biosynthesis